MKILKALWMLPSIIITIIYGTYLLIQVIRNSNQVELELLGPKGVADHIFQTWIKPFILEHKLLLRLFSTIVWLRILIYLF